MKDNLSESFKVVARPAALCGCFVLALGGEVIQMLSSLAWHCFNEDFHVNANPFDRASQTSQKWTDYLLGPEQK